MTRLSVPGGGWYVEVDLPGGRTVRPDVVGDPQRNPQVNGFPRLLIPVRKRRVWDAVDIESNTVAMRAWFDGIRQPVDELERVRQAEGETVVLEGRGGVEGDNRVRKDVNVKRLELVAEEVIQNNTTYTANVDRAPTTTTTNAGIDSGTTTSDWSTARAQLPATSPVTTTSGTGYGNGEALTLSQTTFFQEAEDIPVGDRSINNLESRSTYSDTEAVVLDDVGHFIEFDFTPGYTMPADKVGVGLRFNGQNDTDGNGDTDVPETDITIDGAFCGGFANAADVGKQVGPSWSGFTFYGNNGGDISSTATCRVEIISTNATPHPINIDCVVVYDTRYHGAGNFDNNANLSDALETPTTYPSGNGKPYPEVEFEPVQTVQAVTGGRIEVDAEPVTSSSDDPVRELALSNDRGATYSTQSTPGGAYEVNFGSDGASLTWRMQLGGVGDRSSPTPTKGFDPPVINSYTLEADLEDKPLIVDQSFDGSVQEVLRNLAESFGDFIFEYRIDQSGNISVEWTQPGQRTTDRDDPVAQFERERSVEEVVGEVIIKGGAVRVQGESLTADHGNAVSLNNEDVVAGSETVRDGSGTVYVRGADYEVAALDGTITTLSSGDITDGQSLLVDYRHKPKNSYQPPAAPSGAKTIVETLPELSTSRSCGQAARLIGEDLDSQLVEGQVVIPSDEAGWDVVSAVDFAALPFEGSIELRDVENSAAETVLRVGSRQTASDLINQIESRLRAVSERA